LSGTNKVLSRFWEHIFFPLLLAKNVQIIRLCLPVKCPGRCRSPPETDGQGFAQSYYSQLLYLVFNQAGEIYFLQRRNADERVLQIVRERGHELFALLHNRHAALTKFRALSLRNVVAHPN
jgi:hypothetical protein